MAEVKSLSKGSVGKATLDDSAVAGRHNPVVLREAVLMYEANRRVGTASTLSRNQIKGSTHKIYRQKGTGRARHGDRKAPQFRGGGVAHGPKPRDYSYSLPRKALRRALLIALAGKFRDEEVLRWEGDPAPDAPSTKTVRQALEVLGAADSALLVAPGAVDRNLLLSVRNLRGVRALPAREISAYDVVRHRYVVMLDGAWEAVLERLGDVPGAPAAEGDAS
jgi:large subunit ribosomal protein L4